MTEGEAYKIIDALNFARSALRFEDRDAVFKSGVSVGQIDDQLREALQGGTRKGEELLLSTLLEE